MTIQAAPATTLSGSEVDRLRADFPILGRLLESGDGGSPHRLIYLDSGATSQRPRPVLDAERRVAETSYSAMNRGAHTLAGESTDAFEGPSEAVARFVGVPAEGLVWTRNATEGINIIPAALTAPDA